MNQSINQSINKASKQAIKEGMNQGVNESTQKVQSDAVGIQVRAEGAYLFLPLVIIHSFFLSFFLSFVH